MTSPPRIDLRADKAIVPTSTGQIGINPVESDLGDADTYIGAIYGTDTQYIFLVNETSTQWVATNPSYLSVTTINPTNTSTVQVVVATATADGNGQHAGHISMILPEKLVESMKDSFTAAAQTCNAVTAKRFRRNPYLSRRQAADDVLACLLSSAAKDTADGGLFDQFINPSTWQDIEIVWLAAYAAASQVVTAGIVYSAGGKIDGLIGKLNFPKTGLLKAGSSSTTTTSSDDCASTATKGADSPLCNEDVCQGNNGLCAVNPNKNCPCLSIIPDVDSPQSFDLDFLNWQQTMLMSINATAYDPTTTSSTTTTTNCSFQTSSYNKAPPGSSIIMTSAVVCNCNGDEQISPKYAVSGTNTTSWCDNATPVPSGYTRVSVSAGLPVSTTMSTPCSIVTTSYPKTLASSSTTMASAIICQCAFGNLVQPGYAVSGKSTTSWCHSTTSVPAGFTKLSVSNGFPIPLPITSSTTSSASTASPSPNKEVILIWSYPPKTGAATYDAYLVALGYNHNLSTDCTEVVGLDNSLIPLLANVPDPSYLATTTVKGKVTTTETRVENMPSGRPDGGVERRAPGTLGKFEGYDCTYEEQKLFDGSVVCGDKTWKCNPPNADEEEAITPNFGACDDIKIVRPLVMICPVNLGSG
ncbi:hypothetical protein EAF04_003885 [Stromatinia cepivora]|nr:hypothetical protein EAF04_003885 [Stromatinia cepivora]